MGRGRDRCGGPGGGGSPPASADGHHAIDHDKEEVMLTATELPDVITIPDVWITLVVGSVLPAIVALVTSRWSNSWVKPIALIALSVISGALIQIEADGG